MLSYLRKVTRQDREKGASAVEYGLMVAAIAAIIVVVVFALGGVVKNTFQDTCKSIATTDTDCAGTGTGGTNATPPPAQ